MRLKIDTNSDKVVFDYFLNHSISCVESQTKLPLLTRSLSAAGSNFSTSKSSAETSGDVWPWHRTDSRLRSSSPWSIPELSMVLVPKQEEEQEEEEVLTESSWSGAGKTEGPSSFTGQSVSRVLYRTVKPRLVGATEKERNFEPSEICTNAFCLMGV